MADKNGDKKVLITVSSNYMQGFIIDQIIESLRRWKIPAYADGNVITGTVPKMGGQS